jgi:tRNA pseudouridine synthase 10
MRSRIEDFVNLVVTASKEFEFETFLIGTRIDPDVSEAEEGSWVKFQVDTQEPIKGELNREIGKVLEKRLGKEVDFGSPHVTFVVDTRYNNIETTIRSLYIYGRYRKLQRGIPQTKWFCRKCRGYGCEYCDNTGKMYPTSVEELVGAPLLEAARGESHSFHGMGREDIDALMLGNGRPFVLEITNPKKRTLELEEIMEKINQDNKEAIEIEGFEYSDLATVRGIKSSRSRKTYRVNIEFGSEPDKEKVFKVANNFRNLQIQQQTPKRVSHRRANLKRKRTVHSFEIMDLAGTLATIEIIGESGLYIKELIHGDDGRTNPSLSSELGIDCTVKSLDVVHIWDQDDQKGDE